MGTASPYPASVRRVVGALLPGPGRLPRPAPRPDADRLAVRWAGRHRRAARSVLAAGSPAAVRRRHRARLSDRLGGVAGGAGGGVLRRVPPDGAGLPPDRPGRAGLEAMSR